MQPQGVVIVAFTRWGCLSDLRSVAVAMPARPPSQCIFTIIGDVKSLVIDLIFCDEDLLLMHPLSRHYQLVMCLDSYDYLKMMAF